MMDRTHRAYVALGSNLDDPIQHLRRALVDLDAIRKTRVIRSSHLYRNPPLGPQDQPDFVNAVACLETELEPRSLLEEVLAIERAHGRVRDKERWGPRTLDIDILLYDDRVIEQAQLRVPHPALTQRSFVLYPLLEIAPELVIPGQGPVASAAARLPRGTLERVD
jgi:2-amino-4-hydroxy-6-hydroxymethyldihydropteridine diphosphokinase